MTENSFLYDLLQAQKEIEGVDKDGKNPFFKSEYTTLNATILACKEILNKHNIVLLQPIVSNDHGVYVATTIFHVPTGEKIESNMRIEPAKINDPQAQGSAITYARRYSLKSFLCMSDDDDDGERATARTAPNYTKKASAVSYSNAPKSAVNDESGQWCDYHKCSMKMNVNNKPYHRDGNRNEGDQFCNGIGFPSEISEHKEKLASQRKHVSLPPEN